MVNQTFFVLAALIAVMIFSLNQHEATVRTEMRQIEQSITATAGSRAGSLLGQLGALPFDPAVPVEVADSLSIDMDVSSSATFEDFQSLNDARAFSGDTVYTSDSLEFVRTLKMQFVEADANGTFVASSEETFYKEITVTLESTASSVAARATRSRVFSYVPSP